MKLLVTGGAGFIGHHLVGAILAGGDDGVVLDALGSVTITGGHEVQVHPETGTLQVFETQAAEQPAVIERPELELEAPPAPVPSPVGARARGRTARPPRRTCP